MFFIFIFSALLFIAHGFGEHCARYEELATALAQQGFLVFAHDHGKSGQIQTKKWLECLSYYLKACQQI